MFGVSKEKRFWKWFEKNENRLFAVVSADEPICDDLHHRMRRIDQNLTFLFGPPQENGKREFIVSADGRAKSFPAVEALWAAAPELPRWTWIKFRPRIPLGGPMTLGGRTYPESGISYKMYEDEGKVGLEVFMVGLTDEDRRFHQDIGILYLDHALGEYDVETRVGFIEFISAADERAEGAHPFTDLQEHFDNHFQQRQKGLH